MADAVRRRHSAREPRGHDAPGALRVLREVALVACEDTRRTATPAAGARDRHPHDVVLRAQRALEGRAHPGGAPRRGGRGARLRRRDARDLGSRLPPGARRACRGPRRRPGPRPQRRRGRPLASPALPTDRFLFVGFLPSEGGRAPAQPRGARAVRETLVFYESPAARGATLADMAVVLGDREAFLCREATKLHEEYVRGTLPDLHRLLAAREEVKGEIVLVVAGAPEHGDPARAVARRRSPCSRGSWRRAALAARRSRRRRARWACPPATSTGACSPPRATRARAARPPPQRRGNDRSGKSSAGSTLRREPKEDGLHEVPASRSGHPGGPAGAPACPPRSG